MRKGKGDLEPAKLIRGFPPVQLKDTMLERDSGAGEQDRGLHRAEHGLCEERHADQIMGTHFTESFGGKLQIESHISETPIQ